MQGADEKTARAIEKGMIDLEELDDKAKLLLRFVKLITETAYRTTEEDVERLRQGGWNDNEISEAIYVTAMFAMFNRVADAFGLKDPNYREIDESGTSAIRPAEKFQ